MRATFFRNLGGRQVFTLWPFSTNGGKALEPGGEVLGLGPPFLPLRPKPGFTLLNGPFLQGGLNKKGCGGKYRGG